MNTEIQNHDQPYSTNADIRISHASASLNHLRGVLNTGIKSELKKELQELAEIRDSFVDKDEAVEATENVEPNNIVQTESKVEVKAQTKTEDEVMKVVETTKNDRNEAFEAEVNRQDKALERRSIIFAATTLVAGIMHNIFPELQMVTPVLLSSAIGLFGYSSVEAIKEEIRLSQIRETGGIAATVACDQASKKSFADIILEQRDVAKSQAYSM